MERRLCVVFKNQTMSRFLNGISKPSSFVYKKGSRVFSSSIRGPFRRFGNRQRNDCKEIDVHHLFDASKECDLTVPNRTPPRELHNSRLVGTTLGWGLYLNQLGRSELYISDYLNPLASEPNPKVIPFSTVSARHTFQNGCNVAMSSSPLDDDEDWVIGIKFFSRQLNFLRPYSGHPWVTILAPSHIFQNSNLVYSKRDKMFYLPAPGSNYLCSWDHNFKPDDNNIPKFHKYTYGNRARLSQSEYELLDSCYKTEHWLESSSGERFLVKCYSLVTPSPEKDPVFVHVYREEETAQGGRYMWYTEDIGDLCIFLSRGDQFCVEASSCPGLKPSSIYTIEPVFGVYDLTTKNFRHFEAPVEGPIDPDEEKEVNNLPYWLPPVLV